MNIALAYSAQWTKIVPSNFTLFFSTIKKEKEQWEW